MKDVIFNFTDKRFVVIGASSGIGLQILTEIVAGGGAALAIARSQDKLALLKERFNIATKAVDVRDRDAMETAITEFVNMHGKIHGSIYTAGISKTTVLRSYSQEEATTLMDINFWGWINLMTILNKKKFTEDCSSHIVISSVSAHKGEAGSFAYNASKASLITCVKTFAKELAKRKCRVNAISPGFIHTPLSENYFDNRGFSDKTIEKHLLGLGKPEDVSGLALFLLSDRAKWITGAEFIIDGGYLISD